MITDPLVKDRRLESIGINPGSTTTSRNSLGLKEFNQPATPPLASNLFVHPKRSEVEPAVVGISVGATEYAPALTQPNGHRDLDAISTKWRRVIELFESVVENLDIDFAGIGIQFETEILCFWLAISHEGMISQPPIPTATARSPARLLWVPQFTDTAVARWWGPEAAFGSMMER